MVSRTKKVAKKSVRRSAKRPTARKVAKTSKATKATKQSKAKAASKIVSKTLIAPGPRKQRKPGAPAPRLTLHKKRANWFRARVAWPLREAPLERLKFEQRRVARSLPNVQSVADWELAGPVNIGGRCTSIVCDPQNPDHIWIGAAGGGVWASKDAGKTWKPQWKKGAVLNIGALAMDTSNSSVMYCGTGEANLSADSYPGDGVYRTVNGGISWALWAGSANKGIPRRIGTIAVNPFDAKHVMVGGVGFGRLAADNDFGGLYVTRDGGTTWKRETFISANNYWCHCVVFDPNAQGTIYATFTGPGAASGIYKSTNNGAAWTQLKTGLPAGDIMGRTSLALAPSNTQIIYANVADASSDRSDGVLGVFRSKNGGSTWTNVAGNHFADEGQMFYGNAIVVHPTNPNHVVCGGVDLHLTTNGGTTWRRTSQWDADRGTAKYAHADHHALLMPAADPGRLYSANDGGLDVSEDGGVNWVQRSNGLSVTMFYDLDIAQTDAKIFGGGAQDNGTLITESGKPDEFFELLGGDGGWMVVDPKESTHIFASFQFGGMYRFRNGTFKKVSPPFKDTEMGGVWMVYIAFDPVDQNTVYTGSQRLYRTKNDGVSWDAITPILDGSPISAIEIAAADRKRIYVGTENGSLFRSTDGGVTWSGNLATSTLPGVMVTRIETHPAKANTVYVTVANFGNAHVFKSTDGGLSWADIDNTQLPDVPHHAVLVRPDATDTVYVCNDAGVFVSTDGGATWLNSTLQLPNAMVVDLVYHQATKTLYAATYGRSIWKLRLA